MLSLHIKLRGQREEAGKESLNYLIYKFQIGGVDWEKKIGWLLRFSTVNFMIFFLHSKQLVYFMNNLMNCYSTVLKKKNKVMWNQICLICWSKVKCLCTFFFFKIREIYYHCSYQSVCECKNVHYLYSNINACGNLLYIAPAEQTTPSPEDLRRVQYKRRQHRKNTI